MEYTACDGSELTVLNNPLLDYALKMLQLDDNPETIQCLWKLTGEYMFIFVRSVGWCIN